MQVADFRKQALTRKLIYFGCIVALWSLQMVHRSVIKDSAEKYDLQETNIGQIDLGGSAARFALTSFRGPLICALWWEAEERKKRHEWNELELLVKTLAKLQPHFKGPWKYQAWNLAYNVSVEFDRVQEKYFYIAEGTKWLAEGERINRNRVWDAETNTKRVVGDPDLRQELGFAIQDKMNLADEAKHFRCLLPLSCIAPENWDPSKKLSPELDPQKLIDFKDTFRQWTHRFREWKKIPEGATAQLDQEILTFLQQTREAYHEGRFPSLYHYDPRLRRDEDNPDPYPVWPQPENEEGDIDRLAALKKPGNPENEGVHNSFEIAKLWYEYATIPLPDPHGRKFVEVRAEKKYHRMPRGMVSLIFRNRPVQAESNKAKSYALEGWFDASDMETGNAQDTWRRANKMWLAFGRANGLEVTADEFKQLERQARKFAADYPELAKDLSPPRYQLNNPEVRDGIRAMEQLGMLSSMKHLANYDHWKLASETYSTPEAVRADRYMYNGAKRRSDLSFALGQFEQGLSGWEKIISRPRFIHGKIDATFLLAVGPHTLLPSAFNVQAPKLFQLQEGTTDFAFLLAAGPHSQLPISYLMQSQRFFELTPVGADHQMQEDLIEMEDGYVRVRARVLAPPVLQTGMVCWELSRALTRQAAAPCAMAGLAGIMPSGPMPLSVDQVIEALELKESKLDRYMSPELIFSRGVRADRFQNKMQQMMQSQPPPQPPPGATMPGGMPPGAMPPGGRPQVPGQRPPAGAAPGGQ